MKELNVQRELIEAVIGADGAAHKLSNRFLTGVADLLIKLPRYPVCLLEVKIDEIGATTTSIGLTPTMPQIMFLRKYHAAGVPTGVMSCLVQGKQFGTAIVDITRFERKVRVLCAAHRWCQMGPADRRALMLAELTQFLRKRGNK